MTILEDSLVAEVKNFLEDVKSLTPGFVVKGTPSYDDMIAAQQQAKELLDKLKGR